MGQLLRRINFVGPRADRSGRGFAGRFDGDWRRRGWTVELGEGRSLRQPVFVGLARSSRKEPPKPGRSSDGPARVWGSPFRLWRPNTQTAPLTVWRLRPTAFLVRSGIRSQSPRAPPALAATRRAVRSVVDAAVVAIVTAAAQPIGSVRLRCRGTGQRRRQRGCRREIRLMVDRAGGLVERMCCDGRRQSDPEHKRQYERFFHLCLLISLRTGCFLKPCFLPVWSAGWPRCDTEGFQPLRIELHPSQRRLQLQREVGLRGMPTGRLVTVTRP